MLTRVLYFMGLLVFQDPALRTPIAISLGAIAGALSRYYLTVWFTQRFGTSFPYGTFVINLTGCLGMGFFSTLALERIVAISSELRLLVATGFLGAYTTFSTYGLETVSLLRNQNLWYAGLYGVGSAVLGVISIQLGTVLARGLK
ncbi:fluoride efflux transporter CrcB [Trichocoleus desertorum]|uniref:fluoride efflux transporter CrcB n=1 Tax=Trichocoleus desertorum TaxID=1481672 RepID=UPI003D64DF01